MRRIVGRLIATAFVASTLMVAAPSHALAATPVVTNGAPAAATGTGIAGAFHFQYVFWAGANGYLWWAHWDGSWHQPQSTTQSGQLGSAPTVAISDSTGYIYVFWTGFDNALYEFYSTNDTRTWNGPIRLASNLSSAPTATSDPLGNIVVFWQGVNNDLYWDFYRFSTGRWSGGQVIPGQGPLGSRPGAMSGWNPNVGAPYIIVSWRGQDGYLWTTFFDFPGNSGWSSPGSNRNLGQIGSPPAIAYAPNGTGGVTAGGIGWLGHYWAGAVPLFTNIWRYGPNKICATSNPCSLPYGMLGSAPTAAGDNNGNVFLFWEGTNGNLWEGFFNAGANGGNGVWSAKPFTVTY